MPSRIGPMPANMWEAPPNICEIVQSATGSPSEKTYELPKGRYEIKIERLNRPLSGYQEAQVSCESVAFWISSMTFGNHSAMFDISDDLGRITVRIEHRYHFFGASTGSVRLTCRMLSSHGTGLEDGHAALRSSPGARPNRSDVCDGAAPDALALASVVSNPVPDSSRIQMMRFTGRHIRRPLLREEVEHDSIVRDARVLVIGKGGASHWRALFLFGDGAIRVCDMNATDGEGRIWDANSWRFQKVTCSLDEYLRRTGCRHIEHPDIIVRTSPAELLEKCKANTRNGTRFDIQLNNCQRWLKCLLVDGYNIRPDRLPTRWGQRVQLATWRVSNIVGIFGVPTACVLSPLVFGTGPVGLAVAAVGGCVVGPGWIIGYLFVGRAIEDRNWAAYRAQ